jgi:hypothetical protein
VEAGLAKSISEIDRETKEILNWLKHYIIWRGRYAIPLNLQEYKNRKSIPSCLQSPDKTNLNIERLKTLTEQLIGELDKVPMPSTHLRWWCK